MAEYDRVYWEDLPSTNTPINAANLNNMDAAIAELYNKVNEFDSAMTDVETSLSLLQRRYEIVMNALTDFQDQYGGLGDLAFHDDNALPKTGGTVSGNLNVTGYVETHTAGMSNGKCGFRSEVNYVNSNSYSGLNARLNNSDGTQRIRELFYGVSHSGEAGIMYRFKDGLAESDANAEEKTSWIIKSTVPYKRSRLVGKGDGNYTTETEVQTDIEIPHPTKLRNWESANGMHYPILTADTIGTRISRIYSSANGSGVIHIRGDFFDGSSAPVGSPWSDYQGWPEKDTAKADIRSHLTNSDSTTIVSLTPPASDIRLKDNIKDSEYDALSILMQFKLRQFDWKTNGEHWDIGFVADEIEELDSNLSKGGGFDDEGNLVIKTIDTFYMDGIIVKALQQAVDRIAILEAKVEQLESKG